MATQGASLVALARAGTSCSARAASSSRVRATRGSIRWIVRFGANEEWEPQPLSETIGSVDDDYELADQRFTLEAACRKLPVRERLVLHMRFIEDRTQSEIAATIGLSQMQVSRILRGAIDRLELAAGPELEY